MVAYFQLVGLLMLLYAHIFTRRDNPQQLGRFPYSQGPWSNRGWFSPLGYWFQLLGWILFVGGSSWVMVARILSPEKESGDSFRGVEQGMTLFILCF